MKSSPVCGWLLVLLFSSIIAPSLRAQDRNASVATAEAGKTEAAETALKDYLARPEADFGWKILEERITPSVGGFIHLQLTSQRWQGIVWTHSLTIYEPQKIEHPDHLLLFIGGGSNSQPHKMRDQALGMTLAMRCGARVAVLHQVPNQPLMNGKVEDDLITETWLKYLETGDLTWPLLFPMTKSAVKAMDAVTELAEQRKWQKPKGFVVTGASKRGWTTYLTAASDSRVVAAAPVVIDMLNFPLQIKHQYELWGKPSEQIDDYSRKGLIPRDGRPRPGRETTLWQMMDPFQYRAQLTMPKLLVVGANDRYWSTDAMNLYWDDLNGEKYIFRAANAGHSLNGGFEQAIMTLGSFFRRVVEKGPMPQLEWEPIRDGNRLGVRVRFDSKPKSATLFSARSTTRDFRDSKWNAQPLAIGDDGSVEGTIPIESPAHAAVFATVRYGTADAPLELSTLVYMTPGEKPASDSSAASP